MTTASVASEVADQIRLRTLTAQEWRLLRRMRLAALKESPHSFLARYQKERWYLGRRWRKEFDRGSWVLACLGDEPIGMTGITRHEDIPPGDRYIGYLWIAPSWRRQGAATEFVRKVIDEQADYRVGSIWLWILDGNDAARSLYEKLGFKAVGEPVDLKEFPGRRETRMTLNLSCPVAGWPAWPVAAGVASGPNEPAGQREPIPAG